MKIRRVVTGHSEDGEAIVASDTEVEGIRAGLLPESYGCWIAQCRAGTRVSLSQRRMAQY